MRTCRPFGFARESFQHLAVSARNTGANGREADRQANLRNADTASADQRTVHPLVRLGAAYPEPAANALWAVALAAGSVEPTVIARWCRAAARPPTLFRHGFMALHSGLHAPRCCWCCIRRTNSAAT